jgi:FkbM family methyltransferase
MKRKIFIDSNQYLIEGDAHYLGRIDENFEPETITRFKIFCEDNFQVLDLGANLGLTAIALSNICKQGKVVAIEPIPLTFSLLKKNLLSSGVNNVKAYNFAVGNKEGSVHMEGIHSFLAGSFITNAYQSGTQDFSVEVPVKTLDSLFDSLHMDRVDFIKLDVEGYELFVLEGAKKLLNQYKPTVYLEMNHWCLNVIQRITLPEFRERLLTFFPCIFAIEGTSYLDFTLASNFHHIAHEHLIRFRYVNLIAGFDRDKLLENLSKLQLPELA